MAASLAPTLIQNDFKNWLKGALAALFAKEGLIDFVDKEITDYQNDLLNDACKVNSIPAGTTCSSCTTANILACPTPGFCSKGKKCKVHDPKSSSLTPNKRCPLGLCSALSNSIRNEHRYRGPSWKNTDARGWCTDAYQLAKCYMPPDGYADKTSLAETDFNGVIAVIINNKRFEKKMSTNFSNQTNVCEEARKAGREIRHSANHLLSDKDLVSYIDVFIQLLSDPVYLATDAKAVDAVQKLKQLKINTLQIYADDITSVLSDYIKEKFNDQQTELMNQIKTYFNAHKTDSVKAIDKLQEHIEKGKVKIKAQTESGKAELSLQSKKGKAELKTQTESGIAKIQTQTESGKAKLKTQTESGKTELKTQTESGKAKLKRKTESGKAVIKTQTERGKTELKAQTEIRKTELKTKTESGKAKLSVEIRKGKAALKTQTESGKAALKTQTESGKAALKSQTERGKAALKTHTESGKAKLSVQSKKCKAELKSQTESGKAELYMQSKLGKVDLKAQTEKGKADLSEHSTKGKFDVKKQTQIGKAALIVQSKKGIVDLKAQTAIAKADLDVHSSKRKVELKAQIEKGKAVINAQGIKGKYDLIAQTEKGKDKLNAHTELLYTRTVVKGVGELVERTESGKQELKATGKQVLEEINRSAKLNSGNNEDQLLQEFKEELVRLYNEKESMIPASPLVEDHAVPLMKLYVQPPMSAFNKPNAFGHEQNSLKKTSVSSYRKLLLNDDNVPYKNIYVEANAGYGKTSFTQKVAVTWCLAQNSSNSTISKDQQEDVDTLKRFDLLFLLHLRDFHGDDTCLLDDLIHKFVSKNLPSKERFSKDFIGKMLQNKTCLAILDGLDEWVHPETCRLTPGIPHNNYREHCTQLTTTRPWKLSTTWLTPNLIDRQIEISTLDDKTSQELKSNAVKLLSENSGEREPDLNDFDRKVSSVKLGEIRLIPYILLQLICIWFDGLSIGKSKCETYSNTIELTLQRGLNKKNEPTLPTGNAERNVTVPECLRHNVLCNQYMNLVLKVGKLAFYALFQKIKEFSLVIDSTTVLKFLTEQELEFCLKIGLLSQSKDRSKVSVKRYQVFFQHKSIQEFMAALYIVSEWNDGTIKSTILEVCSSLSSILEMENLFVFVCGINPEVYTCISGELQTIVDLDSSVCQFRTDMYIARYGDAWKSMKSYQSMQLECLQESLRNGNDSCPIPLYFVLDKHGLTYDVKALKSIMQGNESIGKSPQVSLNEKIVASMLSDDRLFVFMQSLNPGVFTSLETLRVEDCDKEPVWLADIFTESARTLKCLTLSANAISLSDISITALTGLTCLQSLYLRYVDLTHSNLKCLYAYISQTTTLTQLKLAGIDCSDHRGQYRDCDVTLDLHRLNELKMLHLHIVPCRELHVNPACLEKLEFSPWEKMTARASAILWQDLRAAPVLSSLTLYKMTSCQEMIQTIPTLTQLQHLKLVWIDMGDVIPRVSPEMTHLEHVELQGVTMSSAAWQTLFLSVGQLPRSITVKLEWITMTSQAWRELLLSVGGLQHPVTVKLSSCKGPSKEDWRTIVNVIKTTPTLSLLQDLSFEREWFGDRASLTLKNQ